MKGGQVRKARLWDLELSMTFSDFCLRGRIDFFEPIFVNVVDVCCARGSRGGVVMGKELSRRRGSS
jgi:hypothetical protein